MVREFSQLASNWRSSETARQYLERNGVPVIWDMDTRALVRHLRNIGALRGIVATDGTPAEQLIAEARALPTMAGQELASRVTTAKKYDWTKCSIDLAAPIAVSASAGATSAATASEVARLSTADRKPHLEGSGDVARPGAASRASEKQNSSSANVGSSSTHPTKDEQSRGNRNYNDRLKGEDLSRDGNSNDRLAVGDSLGGRSLSSDKQPLGKNGPLAPEDTPRHRVVAYDFGIKQNILRLLVDHKCEVTVVPAQTSAEDVLALKPHGVFLSNGPGDPEPIGYAVENIRKLLGRVPIFGICLGHQLCGLALGGRTFKLKFGHHGSNHPVKNLLTQKVEITSQNHGFCVDPDSLPTSDVEITHVNLNDHTNEGMRHRSLPLFSVQYHPEASPGPHDARYLFDDFITLMTEGRRV